MLAEGEVSNAFFFCTKGFVRLYYNLAAGEKTTYFYGEGDFISAYESYVKGTPARFFLQATEPSQVVVISQAAAGQLLQRLPRLEAVARMAMEAELIANQRVIAQLLTLTPAQRYEELLAERPDIFQRVPQRMIASYIGIAPESLSRLKKRQHRPKS